MKLAECVLKVFTEGDCVNFFRYVFIIDADESDCVLGRYEYMIKNNEPFVIKHYEMDDTNTTIKAERTTILSCELLKRSLLTVCAIEYKIGDSPE
jgi:hypothetical protein